MEECILWFTIGLQHILDVNGYDHILYIASLAVLFNKTQFKKLALLVTAFTVGHSATLAFSVFNAISFSSYYIELFIPITIMITCLFNLFITYKHKSNIKQLNFNIISSMALLFGCVHGLGFSSLLKSMLGLTECVVLPLFYFNTGLEVGQLIIVCTVLFASFFLVRFGGIRPIRLINTISIFTFSVALYLFLQRL